MLAGDYVNGMWMILQQPEPEDFVLATGITHSIRELLDIAFGTVGLIWQYYVEAVRALVKDPAVGLLSPILLALRAFGQCAGLVAAFFHAGRGSAQVTTDSPVGS